MVYIFNMGRSKRSRNKKNNAYSIVKQEKAELKRKERQQKRNDKNKQKYMEETTLIAVYDDFRFSGEHHHFIEGSEVLGTFETLPRYNLGIIDEHAYREPILTEGSNSITMEVYKVDKTTLKSIENHIGYTSNATSFMLKKTIETPWGIAIVYLNNEYENDSTYSLSKQVRSGDWIDYRNTTKTPRQIIKVN